MKPTLKNAALLSLLLLLAATFAACDSALEEDPESFIGPSNFYRNAEDARAALNGAYRALLQTDSDYIAENDWLGVVEFPTEVVLAETGPGGTQGAINNFLMTPSNSDLYSVYQGAYDGINRANAVLNNVPGIENMDSELRAQFVAEARFLRALHYFNLVSVFGGVPLIESETTGLTNLEQPRAPADSIYTFVIDELEAAIPDLPLDYSAENYGRASKGAAQMLLAKVYMQRGSLSPANGVTGDLQIAQPDDYQNALDLIQQVIGSGKYGLVPDYSTLFASPPPEDEKNEEVVFAIQSAPEASDAAHELPCRASPDGSAGGNWDTFASELPFFESFPDEDARKNATYITEFETQDGEIASYDPEDPEGDTYEDPTPAFGKYSTAEGLPCDDENDFLLLRYADLLLMKAEALNEVNQGPTAEAYAAVNQVRERAGVEPLASGLGYEGFREALYVERRRELAFEGWGWFDGQRFFSTFGRRVEEAAAAGFPPQYWAETVDVQDPKHRLMPIPQQALDRNSELTQNPGY
jgi:hypothetical protein